MDTDVEKLYRKYIAAWLARDIEAVVSFFVEDCIYEDVALGALNRGKSEVRTFVQATLTAIPDFKIEPKSVFATVDRLASEWIMTAPRRSVWKLTERIDSSRARWGLWATRYSELSTNPRGGG